MRGLRVTLAGVQYLLRFVKAIPSGDCWGHCDPPDKRAPKIEIVEGMPQKQELRITLHELMHGADFEKPESVVKRDSRAFSEVLWKLGWRKQV